MIKDYVREEALHREAKALGMDKNDYIIKRRMIQSIEFITDGFVTAAVESPTKTCRPTTKPIAKTITSAPYVTFTHVFFDGERHESRRSAFELAKAKLAN